jgi:putative tricarboxylic transport membrane protein
VARPRHARSAAEVQDHRLQLGRLLNGVPGTFLPLFASILRIRYAYLAPGILAISLVGAYASTLDFTTVAICLTFGAVGWLMMKLDFPRAPLVLAVVLAPLLETSLRQSLLLSFGSLAIFVQRPLAAILLGLVLMSLVLPVVGAIRRRRTRAVPARVA